MRMLLLLARVFMSLAQPSGEDLEKPHVGRQLVFQPLLPGEAGEAQTVLRVIQGEESSKLLFELSLNGSGPQTDEVPNIKALGEVTARMHLPGGQVVETDSTDLQQIVGAVQSRWSWSASTSRSFPLRVDQFEEAWIELAYLGEVFWFQIPWGFTRDPRQPLYRPANVNRTGFRPSRMVLKDAPRIREWTHTEHILGRVETDLEISLKHFNSPENRCEIVLHRLSPRIQNTGFGLDLHDPKVQLTVTQIDGSIRQAVQTGVQLGRDRSLRTDSFEIGRFGVPHEVCEWVEFKVTVRNESISISVPSSLDEGK